MPYTDPRGSQPTYPTYADPHVGQPQPAPQTTQRRQPTPDELLAAQAQADANNQVAHWDSRTGTFSYRAKTSAELLQAQQTPATAAPPVAPPTAPQIGSVPAGASQTPPVAPGSVPLRDPGRAGFGAPPAPAGARPAVAGTAPAGNTVTSSFAQPPAAPAPAAGSGNTPGYASVDYSRYDAAAASYDRAINTFQAELDRLSGVDPFGNQAFLRQATDRAAAQAAGIAAGGLSTATARAGNMRQALGTQAATAAQGRDQMEIQRAQDEQTAAGLRMQAAGGIADVAGQRASNETELAKLQTQTMTTNLDAYLKKYGIDATLRQQDVESLRQVALAFGQLDMERYKTDVSYRSAQEEHLVQQYGIDQNTLVALKQIAEKENLTVGEFLMGTVGAVAGMAGGIATAPAGSRANPTSDRRAKFDIRDPDLRDLQDFLGKTKGKLFKYKDPHKDGRRTGDNYGPMAQDLAKSKIGRTVVTKDAEGTLRVDAARLALADHAALSEVARELAELRALVGGGK